MEPSRIEQLLPGNKSAGVSVIIPTYDRDELLQQTLKNFNNQTLKGKFEVIVADNSRRSGTGRLIEKINHELDFPVRYVRAAEVTGPSHPRNVGAGLAIYSYLAFIDDDGVAEPDWLAVIKRFFDTHLEVAILAGRMEALNLEHPLEHSRQYLYDMRDRLYRTRQKSVAIARKYDLNVPRNYYLADYFTGANCAVRADIFNELGGFDPGIFQGQDHDLAHRCLENHCQVAYVPDMRIRHQHGRSYKRFMRQTFLHGFYTTEMVVRRKKTHGIGKELRFQICLLKDDTLRFFKSLFSSKEPRQRSSCFILILVRLIHIAGLFGYVFKRSRHHKNKGIPDERVD